MMAFLNTPRHRGIGLLSCPSYVPMKCPLRETSCPLVAWQIRLRRRRRQFHTHHCTHRTLGASIIPIASVQGDSCAARSAPQWLQHAYSPENSARPAARPPAHAAHATWLIRFAQASRFGITTCHSRLTTNRSLHQPALATMTGPWKACTPTYPATALPSARKRRQRGN